MPKMDPPLQDILDDMHALAADGKIGSAVLLESKLLLYVQNCCIRAYNLGMAQQRWKYGAAGATPPAIPQWLTDMGVGVRPIPPE